MIIGPYKFNTPLILAPMAGISDHPFRKLCVKHGADIAVTEMITCQSKLWNSPKSKLRRIYGKEEPRILQLLGNDSQQLALAAKIHQDLGVQIIDINFGCPAKKVCNKAAGSALMQYPKQIENLLKSVVNAVEIPVTIKMRTGWDAQNRNGVEIAKIAEQQGVSAITVHGRTRACLFNGEAEYTTIAKIVEAVNIPIIANGDINTPEKAKQILKQTSASGLMIGRAARGNPWIFQKIKQYLQNDSTILTTITTNEFLTVLLEHLQSLYSFYGINKGLMLARKHVGWYLKKIPNSINFCKEFNLIQNTDKQLNSLIGYFQDNYTQNICI
jgi:tRNA-dihydrouridine synthase B